MNDMIFERISQILINILNKYICMYFFFDYRMLDDDSYSDIVSWGVNGDSFVVKVNEQDQLIDFKIPLVNHLSILNLSYFKFKLIRKLIHSRRQFSHVILNIQISLVSYDNLTSMTFIK